MDSNLHIEEYIDLNKYWQVLKRRWIPATATFVGIVTLSLAAALASEEVYEAEAQLKINSEDRTSEIVGIDSGIKPQRASVLKKDPIDTEARIFKSPAVIRKLIKELELKDDRGKPLSIKAVRKAFSVEPIIGTDILQVTYEDPDPDVAVAFVSRALEIYSEGNSSFDREEAENARKFIEERLPQAEADVQEAESNLRLFKNRNRIADLDESTTATIGSLSLVENQIDRVQANLGDINAKFNRLKIQLGMTWQEAAAVSSLSQSVGVQGTLRQLQKVKVSLAQQQNYLSDSAPQIISLKDEQADLTALLEQQIDSTLGSKASLANSVNILSLGDLKQAQLAEYAELGLEKEGLENKLASLRQTYTAYQQRSDNLPQLQEQQRELQRKLKATQGTYETLLTRKKEAEIISQKNNAGKVRVVSQPAISEEPVNPDGMVIVAAGAMMGLLFGTALAFLLDLKDNTIKSTEEVENMFAYPLHGIVPNLELPEQEQQLQLPGSTAALPPERVASDVTMMPLREAYRNIQVNLKLVDTESENKVIAITSSVPQEGKSSVSANLAVARAQCGQRILLVDADMRRPTQHHIWEIPNQIGLSDILNQEIEWEDAVQNKMPNLDILTAGSVPENPISLLDSAAMQEFIASASEHYDQIMFDTPPINGIADAKIIGRQTDGFLFVVRPGVADYGSATAAKKTLESTGQKVLGVIVNGADMSREPYYYNSYYYASQGGEA